MKTIGNISKLAAGDDKNGMRLIPVDLPPVEDAPPPGYRKPARTAIEQAEANSMPMPKRPALADPRAELGDVPVKGLANLPDVPARTPLDKSQKTGFGNRLKGAFEGLQNAGLHGANGLQAIGAMIGGAVNRENPNKQLWEQKVELPAIQRRQARIKEISASQKAYDSAADNIEKRNEDADKRYKGDMDQYKWSEDLKAKALKADEDRKAKSGEAEAKRKADSELFDKKNKAAMEMRDRWEKHNAEQKALDRKQGLTLQQMRDSESMRREKFRADNNLERDFYKYTSEAGADTAPSEEDINRDMEAAKSVGMPITRDQAVERVKKRMPKPSKPGASAAAQKIAQKYGGSWGSVPAGK